MRRSIASPPARWSSARRLAVKELIENALDAGAQRIEVAFAEGGKSLIRVTDDGSGIAASDLPLALARHATSKIDGSDLLDIHSLRVPRRGAAQPRRGGTADDHLPRRGASRRPRSPSGRAPLGARPAALNAGTIVTLRDLFHATPARLKFLRSDRAETPRDHRHGQAAGHGRAPDRAFTLRDVTGGGAGRVTFRTDPESGPPPEAMRARLERVLGAEFVANAVPIEAEREGLRMTGLAALPTYSRGAAVAQHLFVNGRPVRDRMLGGALRAAYQDLLGRDRHPAAALFIDCDPSLVDVNVHPAKTEVRFRDPGLARGLIVSGLRHALAEAGHRASSTVADATLGAMRPEPPGRRYQIDRPSAGARAAAQAAQAPGFAEMQDDLSGRVEPGEAGTQEPDEPATRDLPLGAARAQLHENYIVAQTADGVVIVDQHAAHERLVFEHLKRQVAETGVAAQALLIPEVVDLPEADAARLLEAAAELAELGLTIEPFGGGAVAVRETPAILGPVDAGAMLRDILDELAETDEARGIRGRIDAILSRIACHGSVRSGRRMSADEMNALLREMEATPHSGQCNHGRPTYVELKLGDIERLFGRT